MAWYSIGTVDVVNGSKVMTGNGTAWFGALQRGWGFVGPDGSAYEIDSVNSDTQITLKFYYAGPTGAAQKYAAFPTMALAADLVERINALISGYQDTLDGVEFGFSPDATGTLAGRTAYNTEPRGFAYMATDEGKLYFKNSATSGDWSAGIQFGKGEKGEEGDEGPPGPSSTVPGPRGHGWTGGSYASGTGRVTFVSPDGLGFVTGDLRGTAGVKGKGWTGASYEPSDGKITFASSDGLGYITPDIRGDMGSDGWSPVFALQSDGARSVLKVIDWVGGVGSKPSAPRYVGVGGLVLTIGDGMDVRGATGADSVVPGPPGDGFTGGSYDSDTGIISFTSSDGLGFATADVRGVNGWTPTISIKSDSDRRVLEITDWTGGTGSKPATGGYIGPTGIVVSIGDAVDIRGPIGAGGAGSGDMQKSTYDPNDTQEDVYALAHATGTLAFSKVTGAGTAAAYNIPVSGNAATGEVVTGGDTRLSDTRAPKAHTHTKSQITDFPTLGSAALVDTSTLASSDQGVKADTAIQPGNAALSDAREWTADTISKVDAEAGTSVARRAWTANRVKQAVAAWWVASSMSTKLNSAVQPNTSPTLDEPTISGDLTVDGVVKGEAVQASPLDTGADKLMKVGAFGLGVDTTNYLQTLIPLSISDPNDLTLATGFYYIYPENTGISNVPPLFLMFNEGTLHVVSSFPTIVQKLYGEYVSWIRTYDGSEWSPWFLNHSQATTLVPVSVGGAGTEYEGMPTGGLMERGSNANGEYVRFADGTQICTMRVTIDNTPSAAQSWRLYGVLSFPATFSHPPALTVNIPVNTSSNFTNVNRRDVQNWGTDTPSSTTGFHITIMFGGAGVPLIGDKLAYVDNVEVTAIGRWF